MENKEANDKLMSAVIRGDFDMASEALQAGADIQLKTTKGNNLLYVAASRKQEEIFDALLSIEKDDKKIDLNTRNNMGATTLMDFIREDGFINYTRKILEAGANPNIYTNDGMSPLIQACADKKIDEVQVLLEHKADVNYQIQDTKTSAFLMAASQSSMAICEILKNNGADVNALDAFGKNALITAIFKTDSFMKKREKAEHKALCLFLSDIGIDLDYVAPSGMTALWAASVNKNKELTEHLLDKGVKADVWHEIGLEGKMSALHIWMNSQETELVKKLINNGAKLEVKDELGNTAAAYGFMNPNMRDLMMELNADVNSFFYQKKTSKDEEEKKLPVISHIINSGNKQKELVAEMIKRGAKVSFEEESLQKYEPIAIAIASSAYDIVDTLLETKKVNVNKMIKISTIGTPMSALMLAVSGSVNSSFSAYLEKMEQLKLIKAAKEQNDKNGVKSNLISDEAMQEIEEDLKQMEVLAGKLKEERKQIFNSLIRHGANVNLADENGRTAIFIAASGEYAKWLKEEKADLFIKDNDGNNPLVYSVINNKSDLMPFLIEEYKKVNDETTKNIFYQLAFTSVESHLQQDLLEKGLFNYLKNSGVDLDKLKEKDAVINIENINYQDEDGNTPLLVACANNLPFLASRYIQFGANINIVNQNNESPIMHAISSNNEALVEFLVDKGADLTIKTNENKSVLDFAEESENKYILEKIKIGLGHEVKEGLLTGVKKIKP